MKTKENSSTTAGKKSQATKTSAAAGTSSASSTSSEARKQGTKTGNSEMKSSSQGSSSKKEKSLLTLFGEILKDTYDAEKQLVDALPKVAKAVDSHDLRDAFENHLRQTRRHVRRLEDVFERCDLEIEGKHCEAMAGLIRENEEVIKSYELGPVRDSALIIGAQKIEHYEIAAYGSLCELADVLGFSEVHDILGETLEEEEETDELLTDIAMDVNDDAYEMVEEDELEEVEH